MIHRTLGSWARPLFWLASELVLPIIIEVSMNYGCLDQQVPDRKALPYETEKRAYMKMFPAK
jgi:hypothetical protein